MPRQEELRFRAGDVTLAGELVLPDDPPAPGSRYPNALLLASWLPRDRDGRLDAVGHPEWFPAPGPRTPDRHGRGLLGRIADALAAEGVASLRYDKRGCAQSEGSWPEADLFTVIDDARDALAAMRARPDLDLARTGILGHGEGAAVAMSVVIGDPAIGPLTLIGASARSYRDVFRRSVATRLGRAGVEPASLVRAIDAWSEEIVERAERREPWMDLPVGDRALRLSLRGWEQAFHTPPRALATMLDRSVTLVQPRADETVHPDEALLLAAGLTGSGRQPPRVLAVQAAHDLAEADGQVIAEIARDFASRLAPRPLPPVLLAISEPDERR
jgi:hypothetical protein